MKETQDGDQVYARYDGIIEGALDPIAMQKYENKFGDTPVRSNKKRRIGDGPKEPPAEVEMNEGGAANDGHTPSSIDTSKGPSVASQDEESND